MEIVSFTINLRHIGDIIDKNLCELATKKIKRGFQFSPEGAAELTAFHKRVCEGLQAAFGIFMTGDVDAARRLLRGKAELRKAELEAADRHFERLREGRPESLETTSLHLDALARPQAHLFAYLLGSLSGAGSGRRITGNGRSEERHGGGRGGVSTKVAVTHIVMGGISTQSTSPPWVSRDRAV